MPPRVPTQIKLQRGTFRADRAPANEPVAHGKPSCPSWLTDADARKEFRRLTKLLGQMNALGAIDGNTLSRYVLTWVRWRRIVQTLASNPSAEFMVIKDDKGAPKMMQVSAVHSVARSLAEELGRIENSLGMSPAARSRINVSLPPQASKDDKSRFFSDGPFKFGGGA